MARAKAEKTARAKASAPPTRRGAGEPGRDYGTGRLAALQRMADAAKAGHGFGGAVSGAVLQQAALEEEEPLQGMAIQRAAEEEEELQMKPRQRAALEEEEPLQGRAIQRAGARASGGEAAARNDTGLPDGLKAGIEALSGRALDDVRVHYNSSQPAAVQAHAYAQGTDIHVAPGQEQHLPHEAWHVVQQAQGRVKPTTEVAGQAVNDDAGLENEADVMGSRALQAVRER